MTKTIAITAIVLVAVVMGMGVVAPMIPPAFAHVVDPKISAVAHKLCSVDAPLPAVVRERFCDHPVPP